MGLTEATKVSVGENTSSEGPTPRSRSPRCMAAVPEESATAAGACATAAISRSKASRCGPTLESQLLAKASATIPSSWPSMCGTERWILIAAECGFAACAASLYRRRGQAPQPTQAAYVRRQDPAYVHVGACVAAL